MMALDSKASVAIPVDDGIAAIDVEQASSNAPPAGDDCDDDALLAYAGAVIDAWQGAAKPPSLTSVQELFAELIQRAGSAMLRDRVVAALVAAFGEKLGGKRALASTWREITLQAAEKPHDSSSPNGCVAPPSRDEIAAARDALWPSARDLAEAPDLMERVIEQVQALGVVSERELIALAYIAGTSRVLAQPINPLVKGPSSAGKSFTSNRTLQLFPPESVKFLTSSSPLSLVYDDEPLSHTILVVFEANQLQADEHSTYSMLLRTLISEGKIVHQTTIDDPESPFGRRAVRIEREGPICLLITTTGELHAENETRMLSYHVTDSHDQTRGVIDDLAARATGEISAPSDLTAFQDLQRWIALGPTDAVIPFAKRIANKIPPTMVRFRRDVGGLFNFIKASAILHQAQRKIDERGRVVATIDDYRLAYPIFSKVMAQSSGQEVTDAVRAVVELIATKTTKPTAKSGSAKFTRAGFSSPASELAISSEQIGNETGLGKSAAYRAVVKAVDLGFLVNQETRKGKPFRLVLKHQIEDAEPPVLPHPDAIAAELEDE
jgi:hypothetical protein